VSARPFTLRLPPLLARRGFDLARLLAADPARSWAEGFALLEELEVSRPEREFALEVLRRKTNLCLYRCNQRCFCGDFIVVDMSPPLPERRSCVVIELKQGERLAERGGQQVAQHPLAIAEIARSGVVVANCGALLLHGDPAEVLRVLGVGGPRSR
jgi:hypothetical protein